MDNQILDTARELGYLIQQDERFVRAQMAQAAADEDQSLQDLIGEFNLKRIALNTESVREDKDPEKLKKLDGEIREVYATLMENEHMKAYQVAKSELDKLVHQVMTIVQMSAQGEDPDSIDTEPHCSGNCSSCGGCH